MTRETYQSLRIQADDLKAQMTGLEIKLRVVEKLWIAAELAANRAQMSELPELSKYDEKEEREGRRSDAMDRAA